MITFWVKQGILFKLTTCRLEEMTAKKRQSPLRWGLALIPKRDAARAAIRCGARDELYPLCCTRCTT